ncbi:MAG: hypothetical protein KC586_18690 [Myxococcales bacterium]|nr:hypothetical protein [Myxococcales bacterium]
MDHVLELAPSGRATCRTCGNKIAKGEVRFGEAVPSQFAPSGFATEWHHLTCAAKSKTGLVRPRPPRSRSRRRSRTSNTFARPG